MKKRKCYTVEKRKIPSTGIYFCGRYRTVLLRDIAYIETLRRAGVEARVDVYPNWFHAYDMFFPFKKMSRRAIAEFERQYLYATEHYFAEQPEQ